MNEIFLRLRRGEEIPVTNTKFVDDKQRINTSSITTDVEVLWRTVFKKIFFFNFESLCEHLLVKAKTTNN